MGNNLCNINDNIYECFSIQLNIIQFINQGFIFITFHVTVMFDQCTRIVVLKRYNFSNKFLKREIKTLFASIYFVVISPTLFSFIDLLRWFIYYEMEKTPEN